MQQSDSAGNPQAICTLTTEAKLGWLGGIIDGEGSITVLMSNKSGQKKNTFQISPRIYISNTNHDLLEMVAKILNENGVPSYQYKDQPTKNTRNIGYNIVILGWKRVYKALGVISPYLIAKRSQAELLAELCLSRLEKGVVPGRNIPYSTDELDMAYRLQEKNRSPQRLYAETAQAV